MSFPLLHKRVLLIRPIEAGGFPAQLIDRLVEKGMKVYVWVWCIDDLVLVMDRIPETVIPIMIDDTVKHPARELFMWVPSMDFIIKFSESKDDLSSVFIDRYGYLIGQHAPRIKEVKRSVGDIIQKFEKVNGGLILNIHPESKNILTQPIKNLLSKSGRRHPSSSPENDPLIPQESVSRSVTDDEQNTGVLRYVSRLLCCCSSVGRSDEDVDGRIRSRLREVHWGARNRWRNQVNEEPDEKLSFERDLVREQINVLEVETDDDLNEFIRPVQRCCT